MPTSHGSLVYKGRGPVAADSIHVARLRAAGAVPIGKTAAPEFGTLNFTKTKAWGITRNPWALDRTPGGSSGGSAAAVAAGLVPCGTASDGGGSTRIPAAFAGLVGMKPSHGRIPHPGPSGSQTAVYGLLTTTVADSARHLDVIAGPDGRRPPVAARRRPSATRTRSSRSTSAGLRARWSVDLGFVEHVDPEVAARGRGRAPVAGGRRRARARRRRGAPHRPGADLAQRRGDGPVVLDRRGHVAGRRRRPHALLPRRARADEGLPAAPSSPAPSDGASSSRWTSPRCSTRSTCCSRRPRPSRPSPPRVRRRAAPWPPRSRCSPTSAGTRRSRCRPAPRAGAAGRPPDHGRPPPRRAAPPPGPGSGSRPAPWPRHAPGY